MKTSGGPTELDPERFRTFGWISIGGLIAEAEAGTFADDLVAQQATRVHVQTRESWSSYEISEGSALGRVLTSAGIRRLAEAVIGHSLSDAVTLWGHRYEKGEFIPWHRDADGAIQLLLCLQPARTGCGGAFQIRSHHGVATLHLDAGEAILFDAVGREHSTTPITASPEVAEPTRLVAVARYYVSRR